MFPKLEGKNVEVLNSMMKICDAKYFCKLFNFLINSIFYLKKQPHSKKVVKFFENKDNVALGTSFDFADVNSYSTFKLFAWKRDCTISFELHMTQTSWAPFLTI